MSIDISTTRLAQVRHELSQVIVGQDRVIDRLLVAVLADGHVLLEGAPGLGKTLLLSTLARILGGSFNRIQFTPDLIPSDIVGTRIFRPSSESFDVEPGPILANVVLVDEINRAPARVQSALLEAMAERQVTVGGRTFAMPQPFLVVATQNPVESEGVYPLAEAQRDRFLMRIPVDYPTPTEERAIVARMADEPPQAARLLDAADVVELQMAARRVVIDEAAIDYAIRLVLATRDPAAHGLPKLVGLLEYGASPRASLGLVRSARAMALLRGRERAVPQDVYDVAYDILNARLALSYRALAEGFTIDDVLVELLTTVPAPGSHAWPPPAVPTAAAYPAQAASPPQAAPSQPLQPMPGPVTAVSTPVGRSRGDATDRPAGRSTGGEVTSAPSAGLDLPARLRRIELAVSHKVFGRRDGRHASLVLGHGVEPGEARPYEPGDDVRRMDWSILARTGEPHVRDAIQERDLDVAVLVDRSGSLDFGTVGWRKADLAVNVASAVSELAVLGGDRIGAVVATAGGTTDRADPRWSAASDGPRGQFRTVTARGRGRSRSRHRRSATRPATAGTRDRGLGLHRSRRDLEPGARAARTPKRGHRRRGPRSARAPTARCRPARDRGSRDRPPADDRHERRALPRPPGRGRRSSTRREGVRDPASRRHAPATANRQGVDRSARGLPVPAPPRPSSGPARGVPSHHGSCPMIPFAPDLMFLAPERFALLLVPLAFAVLYLVRQRRRQAYVVRFTDPDLIDTVAPRRPGLRRHLVAAVYLTATALLVIAAARPAMATEVANEPTVVLAFDTSLSMEATDVTPSRIVAAREAAHRFIEVVPAGVRVGLVAFDQTARVDHPADDVEGGPRPRDRPAVTGPGNGDRRGHLHVARPARVGRARRCAGGRRVDRADVGRRHDDGTTRGGGRP